MSTQRHVIKRQTVEITLAKNTQAWELQQALSRIFQRRVPELLDRCLSEASSSDCLHRIDRLELDLGELDSNRLEDELLERIEATLRQALSEEIDNRQSLPVAQQQSNPAPAHLELFEHFVSEGYLPWWADSSQRQLPEKTLTALLNTDTDALKRLLGRIIREPLSLQRLISYFGDNQLIAIIALLTAAPKDSVTALLQILSAVQAPLHQHSRTPIAHLRAALWQSLLQVAVANEPAISRHGEFLSAVTVRWAKLQGLPQPMLTGCFQQLLANQTPANNEWLQAIELLMRKERVSVKPDEVHVGQSADDVSPPKMLAPAVISHRYAMLWKRRFIQPELDNELSNADEMMDISSAGTSTDYSISPSLPLEEGQGEDSQKSSNHQNPQYGSSTDYRRRFVSPVAKTGLANSSIAFHRRLALTVISSRYSMLKSIAGGYAERAQKNINEPLAGNIAINQQTHKLDNALSLSSEKVNTFDTRSAFSDADAIYINNAGLCILWPFLGSFFERLELMLDGRFHDQAAKQCAASLLHYLVYEELNPPEYMLPFNKLLCAISIDDVFDWATPLTTAQTVACDELLEAVVGNAPILNKMSVNGFRGSFLLRQGSLSASEGSWLLRVERETYDLVLERLPWSWQWFKLPWMEYPMRVEW